MLLSDKYVKKWAGLPRCATNTFLHMSHGMNIKSISALYHETHAVSHARTRLKGDSQVNHALDCRISRESEWTRKQSTTVKAQETLDLVEDLNIVCGVRPGFAEVPATITKYHNTVKEAVKSKYHPAPIVICFVFIPGQ